MQFSRTRVHSSSFIGLSATRTRRNIIAAWFRVSFDPGRTNTIQFGLHLSDPRELKVQGA
jgi:hypothetical protein